MSDIYGTVLGVTGRKINTRYGERTVYDVAFSDGTEYGTFNEEIATKANALVGKPVAARVETTQKPGRNPGQVFTNHNLLDIAPQEQLAAQAPPLNSTFGTQPVTAVPAATNGLPLVPAISPTPINITSQADDKKEREERITRMNALGTAHNFVGSLFSGMGPEAFAAAEGLALKLARELYAIALTGVPDLTTPQAVAEQVNEQIGTSVVTVGATPVITW